MTATLRRDYRLVRRPAAATVPVAADPWQRLIVEHTAGPLLVIGGPGTGKTSTLVEAVATRVASGVDPERILVLTFGRRGAVRLRDRIEARLGRSTGLRTTAEPMVRTFHGYAFGLLRRAAVERGEPSPRLLTGPEQDLVIRELLAGSAVAWPPSLESALPTRAFATELRDLLLRAVERGVGPAGLARLAQVHGRADWAAAAHFFQEYQQVLALRDATSRGSAAFDYAELVRAAVALLAGDSGDSGDPRLLEAERRRLSYIYVDELQDTDPAQVELLELIAGAHLVAFADPDSSTFAFRGADPSIIGNFSVRFPGSLQMTLPHARRLGEGLLTPTRRVAARLRGPARHRLLQPLRPGGTVETRTFASETSEAAFLAHRLREAHLLRGVPWSKMAVIVRSTARQLAPLQRALHSAGVPTVTEAEDLPLHLQPAIAPLLLLLRCALQDARLDEDAAVALLHSPLGGADPLAERRLRQGLRSIALAAGDRRPSGVLLLEALRNPAGLASGLALLERRWSTSARRIALLLQEARTTAAQPGATAEEVLWVVWQASGIAERWSAVSARGGHRGAAADRDLDAVVSLFDAAARFTDRLPGAGIAVFLDHVEGQDLPADSLAPSADRGDAVRILTAHAAKGLEWDVVAVAGVQEGVWPDLRLRGSVLGSELLVEVLAGRTMETVGRLSALLDEERRLFYVAVTRATDRVLVTAVATGDGEEQPSRFLLELDSDASEEAFEAPQALTLPTLVAELRVALVALDTTEEQREAAAAVLARLAAEEVPGADPGSWWGLAPLSDDRPLVDPGEPVTVTPSTVESVDRCSLRWLLERHGGSLTPSPEQSIGNLVHAAAMLASDATADRAQLVAYVADRFDAIELSARWLAGRERDRAETMLDKLIGWLAGNPRRLVAIEQDFLVELADPESPVEIKGRVDRLELDDQGRLVVVDLKTGKSIPANANLAEHPQLAAYQAAIELGAFDESTIAGGASLVQLGGETSTAREQVQPPLGEAEDPNWAQALVQRTAKTMAASTFNAVVNNKCRVCPVKTSCPVSGKGRHVTGTGA